MTLKIVTYPDPILHKKADAVENVTPAIAKLMDDMTETMYANEGVGLAAPQIGISLRVIVIDIGIDLGDGEKGHNLIQLANPEIISSHGEIDWEEGCLSIPEFRIKMKRKENIVVQGLNKKNQKIEIMAAGLLAVAFQHEIDHIDGKLLIDRASKKEQEEYLKS
ncbi:MAG: peptide deformylase [Deltaproteobacteria bacterium]|nr:peptide deformylase [Deltaproteobacteria bacterium]